MRGARTLGRAASSHGETRRERGCGQLAVRSALKIDCGLKMKYILFVWRLETGVARGSASRDPDRARTPLASPRGAPSSESHISGRLPGAAGPAHIHSRQTAHPPPHPDPPHADRERRPQAQLAHLATLSVHESSTFDCTQSTPALPLALAASRCLSSPHHLDHQLNSLLYCRRVSPPPAAARRHLHQSLWPRDTRAAHTHIILTSSCSGHGSGAFG